MAAIETLNYKSFIKLLAPKNILSINLVLSSYRSSYNNISQSEPPVILLLISCSSIPVLSLKFDSSKLSMPFYDINY